MVGKALMGGELLLGSERVRVRVRVRGQERERERWRVIAAPATAIAPAAVAMTSVLPSCGRTACALQMYGRLRRSASFAFTSTTLPRWHGAIQILAVGCRPKHSCRSRLVDFETCGEVLRHQPRRRSPPLLINPRRSHNVAGSVSFRSCHREQRRQRRRQQWQRWARAQVRVGEWTRKMRAQSR